MYERHESAGAFSRRLFILRPSCSKYLRPAPKTQFLCASASLRLCVDVFLEQEFPVSRAFHAPACYAMQPGGETAMADEQRYLAYLVRLWAVHRNGDVVWRASAENAHTGERRAFTDVGELCNFLHSSVADASPTLHNECHRVHDDAAG
jgi:hypothetical protein